MVATNESIEAVVGRIWPGSEIRIEPIAAGLTNQNYRVEVDGHAHFVRLPGPSTELLAVDRANELHNTRAAATAGVGPRVAHRRSVQRRAGPRVDRRPNDVERGLRRARHARRESPRRFGGSMPAPASATTSTCSGSPSATCASSTSARSGSRTGTSSGCRTSPRIERALEAHPVPAVPCHNDLLAENYLDDGERLRIVDYEYSGNNDPPSSSATRPRSSASARRARKSSAPRTSARPRRPCSPGCACR